MAVNEIITVQVGACGNNIGTAFWDTILGEHWLDKNCLFNNKHDKGINVRLDKINSYFYEKGRGILTYGYIRQYIESKYTHLYIPGDIKLLCKYFIGAFNASKFAPRAILIDSDPTTMDGIKSSNIGNIFNPNNFIHGTGWAGNNYSTGYSEYGDLLLDEIMDNIRYECENCDCLQGFQLCHSIGGGTGSGLTSLIMQNLRDYYPNKINCNFTVYPSPKVSDVVVEPYNATFSIDKLLQFSHETFVLDNEALFNICHNILSKQKQPKYSHLNWLISMVMSGVTASFRFADEFTGTLNGDLRKFGINMVSFPRLHFFLLAQAPLFASGQGKKVKLTVMELTDQMWSSRNFLANVKSEDGKYLIVSCIYRGNLDRQLVEDEVARGWCWKLADDFVTWIPNNIKSLIVKVPPDETSMSGTLIANTTAIKSVFQRISAKFTKMYKRRAFLHWYKPVMDEMDFQNADRNVRDLVTEYQDKQDAVVDLGDTDEDEDEDEDEYDEDEDEDEYRI